VNEAELVAASQRGDIGAFNRLVLMYQEQVYNLAVRLLGERDAAADATQETFLSAFQAIRSFRGGSVRIWLLRIAANACYDELRRQRRHPVTSLDELMDRPEEEGPGREIPTAVESPEDFALRRDLQNELLRALMTLPAEQRMVVVLSDIQGLSYEEIAHVTGTNLGTVKSRLSRARAHLRDYLRARELLPSTVRQ